MVHEHKMHTDNPHTDKQKREEDSRPWPKPRDNPTADAHSHTYTHTASAYNRSDASERFGIKFIPAVSTITSFIFSAPLNNVPVSTDILSRGIGAILLSTELT